jgi:Cdc6-like AAA superfamily ATPase
MNSNIDKSPVQQWLMPYERNPRITGRKAFLESLRQKLITKVPGQFNHCVALYGMRGIGKTQVALEYAYANENNYARTRTYWISGVNQASLLSGYADIAKMEGLKFAADARPIEIAKDVLRWLRQESSWLIIIDNLDVIEIIDGFMPQNGPGKHTIITTRNPNAEGIPAQGLEVPLLDHNNAVELLWKLSMVASSSQKDTASLIVEKLDCLPLAIEQAAA